MVGKAKAQRRRDRSKRDEATLITPPITSLPMSGDVIGTTAASVVDNLSHASIWPAAFPAVDGSALTNLPTPTLAGDVTGPGDANQVVSIANVVTGPAVYPAGNGSLLTSLPPPTGLFSGGAQNLDGSGNLNVSTNPATQACVAMLLTPGSAIGKLGIANNGGGSFTISSSAGGADAGLAVNWIAY